MISVREARNFRGNGQISLAALSRLEHRPFPVSIRELVTVESVDFNGNVSAGDVACRYKVTIYNSGNWYVTADLSDSGDIAGDSYMVEFLLDATHGIGTSLSGELGAGDSTQVGNKGNDPWIRDNWTRLRGGSLKAHLHTTADIGEIIGGVLTGLFIAGVVAFFGSGGKTETRQCRDQPIDNHGQCVEFYKVQE